MYYEISDDARKCTRKCASDFQCLKKGSSLCSITKVLDKTFVIKGPKHFLCSYFLSYGDIFFCLCPTRHELYSRYRI